MSTLRVNNIKDATGGDTSQINSAPPNRLVLSTAQNTTSGTAIDFTGIPSWVKRITVMFNGTSLANFNSESNSILVQLGKSAGPETSGYTQSSSYVGVSSGIYQRTDGFHVAVWSTQANTAQGSLQFTQQNTNAWSCMGIVYNTAGFTAMTAGIKTLSGTLDRVRITTPGGTDTFDAGSVNIMYEG